MKKYLLFTVMFLLAATATAQNLADRGLLKLTIHYLYAADSSVAHSK